MKLSKLALLIAIVAVLLLAVAGPGSRFELWTFSTGFLLMRWALYLGVAAAVASVILLLIPKTRAGSVPKLVASIVIGLATAWVPWQGVQTARSVPPIHDITTDTVNPPQFVAVLPLRADARNPPEYEGEEIAAQQREAYPDIETLVINEPPATVFERSVKAAEDLGWEIVATDAADGRIEATATTFWFGFKDDVVIRIAEDGGNTQLDIRSKSRVGRSDVGANAARIRKFVEAVQ